MAAARQMVNKLPVCLHRVSQHQSDVVRWLLAWRPTTLAAHRARLLTVVATLECLRVNEVALLQVCDLWFDLLSPDRVRGAGLRGDVLAAHHPAEERHAAERTLASVRSLA